LLHVAGVDSVSDSWVKRWTLFEVFMLMLMVTGVWHLAGRGWAMCAAITFVLTLQDNGAPNWSWVAVLVLGAIHRAVVPVTSAERLAHWLRIARFAAAAGVTMIALGYAITEVRVAMYPLLLMTDRQLDAGSSVEVQDESGMNDLVQESKAAFASAAAPRGKKEPQNSNRQSRFKYAEKDMVDPNAAVQTGPGIPRWGWQSVSLSYAGIVEPDREVHLWLLSPWARRGLVVLKLLGLAVMLWLAWGSPRKGAPKGSLWERVQQRLSLWPIAAGVLLCGLISSPGHAQEDHPVQAVTAPGLLGELKERLLAKHPCQQSQTCTSLQSLNISVAGDVLLLRGDVHAVDAAALRLPALTGLPVENVVLDGKAAVLQADPQGAGAVLLAVPAGRHDVVIRAKLTDVDDVMLAFPQPPRRASAQAQGWRVDGVEDGIAAATIRLVRDRRTGDAAVEQALQPLVVVERTIGLGFTFAVVTEVRRLSPMGTPVVVEVPLLPGEEFTDGPVRLERGVFVVGLRPDQGAVSFSTTLPVGAQLALTAAPSRAIVERWVIEQSPLWHVEHKGIPAVDSGDEAGAVEYHPWPGEALRLSLQRPTAVVGQSLTIDNSHQRVTPGDRTSLVELSLSVRASKGVVHPVTLPTGATLQQLRIDNVEQAGRVEDGKVWLSIAPGAHNVVMSMTVADPLRGLVQSPAIGLGVAAVNHTIEWHVPGSRWLWWASSDGHGPAVLFWSMIVMVILMALILSILPSSPMGAVGWLLLLLGLSQRPLLVGAFVAVWLLALSWRGGFAHQLEKLSARKFNLLQVTLVAISVAAVPVLVFSVYRGLLGQPNMVVMGNGSSQSLLRFFADRSDDQLPRATLFTVPMLAWRVVMLAWSLWLATSLVRWLRIGAKNLQVGGFWRARTPVVVTATTPTSSANVPSVPVDPPAPDTKPTGA
jgi:hypothetical protein